MFYSRNRLLYFLSTIRKLHRYSTVWQYNRRSFYRYSGMDLSIFVYKQCTIKHYQRSRENKFYAFYQFHRSPDSNCRRILWHPLVWNSRLSVGITDQPANCQSACRQNRFIFSHLKKSQGTYQEMICSLTLISTSTSQTYASAPD